MFYSSQRRLALEEQKFKPISALSTADENKTWNGTTHRVVGMTLALEPRHVTFYHQNVLLSRSEQSWARSGRVQCFETFIQSDKSWQT